MHEPKTIQRKFAVESPSTVSYLSGISTPALDGGLIESGFPPPTGSQIFTTPPIGKAAQWLDKEHHANNREV